MKYAPYSHSKIDTYVNCNYKFKLKYIDKIYPDIDLSHLEKGKFVHYLLETYPKWDYSSYNCSIAEEVKKYYLEQLQKQASYGVLKDILHMPTIGCEIPFGLDINLNPVNYYDSSKVLGGYIDRVSKGEDCIVISDYKTGKVKEYQYFSNNHQIVLYAIWAFKVFNVDKVIGKYVYVEHDEIREFHFDRKYLKNYTKTFGKDIVSIEKDSEFIKKPSPLCESCEYFLSGFCDKQ